MFIRSFDFRSYPAFLILPILFSRMDGLQPAERRYRIGRLEAQEENQDGKEDIEWILLALLALAVTACSPQDNAANIVTLTPTANPAPVQKTYNDPFAYCAAVGTIDRPDARYTGPEIGDEIINGLRLRPA